MMRAPAVHPLAWWGWALGLAVAASRTTNPLLLALVIAVAGYVVATCRPSQTWARGFRAYLVLGLVVVAIRTGFHILLGGGYGDTVLVRLPQLALPHWAAGITLGGAVTAEGLAAAGYDGLRLATLLICVGAAVTVADPRQLLRTLPGALYELGVVIVVGVSLAPQLVDAALRVRRARSLRGGGHRGLRSVRSVAMPVLDQALDRAVALAAAMDSRGYGRAGQIRPVTRRVTGALLLLGLIGAALGSYGLLDTSAPGSLALPGLLVGVLASAAGLALGSRRVVRSRYRAYRMDLRSVGVAAAGVLAAAAVVATELRDQATIYPATTPLTVPQIAVLPVLGILLGVLPAVLAPARTATDGAQPAPGEPRDLVAAGLR